MRTAASSAAQNEISRLRAGDHLCCIYRDRSEQMGIVVPYLIYGLKNNEKCLYIIEESTREDVFHAFGEAGVDLKTYSASGQFVLLTKEDAYLKGGGFDPDRMIATLKQAEADAIKEGYTGLRVTGEMTWIFTRLPGVEKLIEYESKLNYFLPNSRSSAICHYHEPRFEPDILINVIHTHPKVVIYGAVCENPYYIPPDLFLLRMKSARIPLALYQKIRDDIIVRSKSEADRRRLEAELKALLDQFERSRRAMLSTIEDHKQVEKELRESEERFKQVANNLGEWIWEVNTDGLYTYSSPFVENILGYKPEEVVGKRHFYDWFVPEEREKLKKVAFELFARKKSFKGFVNLNLHKNGTVIFVATNGDPILDQQGRLLGYRGADNDITERKQAKETLRENEKKYRALIETTHTGYVIIDFAGKVLDANDEYVRLTGYERRDEILGRSLLEWTASYDKERNAKAVEKCFRQGFMRNLELDYVGHQGQTIPIEGNGTLVTTKSGPQILALCRDITERKKIEQEREKLIGELCASLEKVKMLSGLLPICASCKRIRDDKGYWNQIDAYIRDHSEAEFTHGICPECMKKLYPDFDIVE